MLRLTTAAMLGLIVAVAACSGGEERGGRIPLGQQGEQLPAGVQEALDAGNTAFRAGEYDVANRHYREAVRLGPDVAACWFGVYMAETKLGNTQAAEEALANAQRLSPGMPAEHPTLDETGRGVMGGMPPGHPDVGAVR